MLLTSHNFQMRNSQLNHNCKVQKGMDMCANVALDTNLKLLQSSSTNLSLLVQWASDVAVLTIAGVCMQIQQYANPHLPEECGSPQDMAAVMPRLERWLQKVFPNCSSKQFLFLLNFFGGGGGRDAFVFEGSNKWKILWKHRGFC